MKTIKHIIVITALTLTTYAHAGFLDVVGDFFANNPTNRWDLSGYGIALNSDNFAEGVKPDGWGGGTRIGYWATPFLGAALDLNYAASSWTFTSLALTARGTFSIGSVADVTPYASAGAGWNINGPEKSIVAVAGAGAVLDIKKIRWFKLFAEYQHVTTTEPQNRILFGITKSF